MKTISMLEFLRDAERIIRQVERGQRIVLTYRGKPVARLEPIASPTMDEDDPFYEIYKLAEASGESLSNREIDEIIYGKGAS